MTTVEQLSRLLKEIADRQWAVKQEPILLSNLPPIILPSLPGYKEALGDGNLKAFVRDAGPESGFKLVEHPSEKGKVGLVPSNADYHFVDTGMAATETASQSGRSAERIIADFLKLLKMIPAEDLKDVHIPVSVLVRLIK